MRRAAANHPARDALTPVLVDYYSRDGSTLTMRLLDSSPQVAVGGTYPFEHKFFAYLWRWSRLLTRPDWDDEEWDTNDLGSILQERDRSVLGPPPWRRRDLMEGTEPGASSMSEQAFEASRGASSRGARRRSPASPIAIPRPMSRYYAEKHMNSWLLDRAELPPLRLLVLLRDPRDTYASLLAFREATKAELGQRQAADEADYFRRFIERQRDRLRWIAGLEEGRDTAIVRYEELVRDLPEWPGGSRAGWGWSSTRIRSCATSVWDGCIAPPTAQRSRSGGGGPTSRLTSPMRSRAISRSELFDGRRFGRTRAKLRGTSLGPRPALDLLGDPRRSMDEVPGSEDADSDVDERRNQEAVRPGPGATW